MGDIVVAGDAIFVERNLAPNPAEGWRYWVPARFVNSYEGWKSVEELDKRADYILPCHDAEANQRSDVFPYEGMPLRKRRQTIPGFQFYFGDMPSGAVGKAAPAMPRDEVEGYLASLKDPKDMAES
jgi:glyoxylase-like metal-dependent hydrolase (beta-lactamase superfamily II)